MLHLVILNPPADKLNSETNSGEIVALIALNNVDIKYPRDKKLKKLL